MGWPKEQKKKPSRKRKARKSNKAGAKASEQKKTSGDINLETAYKLRAKSERDAKQAAGQRRQAEQKRRQKLNEELDALIPPAALNKEGAEESRYFDHRGRIKRVYVTAEQLDGINTGTLAIAQHRGRYFIVTPEVAKQAQAVKPDLFVFSETPESAQAATAKVAQDEGGP